MGAQEAELLLRKQVVLKKFYGGERQPYYHDFMLTDGVCIHCNVFVGAAKTRICNVITSDEAALFRIEER